MIRRLRFLEPRENFFLSLGFSRADTVYGFYDLCRHVTSHTRYVIHKKVCIIARLIQYYASTVWEVLGRGEVLELGLARVLLERDFGVHIRNQGIQLPARRAIKVGSSIAVGRLST